MNYERIFPKKSKLLKLFSIYCIVLLILIYGIFSSRFGWIYLEESQKGGAILQDVIALLIWAIISAFSLYIFLKENYYVILKEELVHHKFTKETKYRFSEILYVDEIYTKKHGTLLFYDKNAHRVYLVLDKESKVLDAINKKAKNLISRDEFHKRFPTVSL